MEIYLQKSFIKSFFGALRNDDLSENLAGVRWIIETSRIYNSINSHQRPLDRQTQSEFTQSLRSTHPLCVSSAMA
jgi:hypothetical protein